MLLDHVTAEEMQAARIVTGAAMAGFLAAQAFGRRARQVRIGVAVLYGAAVMAAIFYYLL